MSQVNSMFAPQGWQCPICKRVYSPTTSMCYYCGNQKITYSSETTGNKWYLEPNDYVTESDLDDSWQFKGRGKDETHDF